MDLDRVIAWIAIGIASSPIWGALLFELWDGMIRPHLISRAEIDRRAAEMIAHHGRRAAQACLAREDRGWYDCDAFESATWRRVRTAIERRQGASVERA